MAEGTAGGRKGKPKGQVHAVFADRLKDLKIQAQNLYKSVQGTEQRKWQIPSDLSVDLFEIAKLHEPSFNRTTINVNYQEATQDPDDAGTNGDTIALKLQLDYNAAEERAFRHRHASPVRNICHAHGRRYGHGEGRTLTATREEVERFIAAGGASS